MIPLSNPDVAPPSSLTTKLVALGRRHEAIRAEAQRAETAEALTRTRLGEALAMSLAACSRTEAALREAIFSRHLAAARRHRRPARRNRLRRLAERLLARLGSPGRTLLLAWAGLGQDGSAGLFDPAFYQARNPDVAASGQDPIAHYLLVGGREGRSPHPLFDHAFYARQAGGEMAATGLTALEHYLRLGAAAGLAPHPLFDPREYVAQAPELADTGENPLLHYLRIGGRQDLNPHPLFQSAYYRAQASDLPADANPLLHYLTTGSAAGLKPHPLFDPAWCRQQNSGLDGSEPLQHFVEQAGHQDLSPGPWFDAPRYKALRGADRPPTLDPLTDYLRGGAWAVAEPNPGFQAFAYLVTHPELAAQGLTPLEHWARKPAR